MHHRWLSPAFAAAAVLVALPASAAPPATANVIQVGLGFRYGFELEEGTFNPWGRGLGVGGGYTLPNAIYLGGNFDYFFGDEEEFPGGDRSGNVWQIMGEGGYDLGIGPNFVVRPKVGIGGASLASEVCLKPGTCTSASEMDLAIAPGSTFVILTSKVSVSLDLRYNMTFASERTLKALILSAGVGF